MVIILNVADYNVHRMLVDNRSSVDMLFYDALLKMSIPFEQLEKLDASIIGFLGEPVPVEGTITLLVIVGSASRRSQMHMTFIVVKTLSVYNVIFGRLGLNTLCVIVSTCYLLVRFSTLHGVGKVHGDQTLTRQCYFVASQVKPLNSFLVEELDIRDELAEKRENPRRIS